MPITHFRPSAMALLLMAVALIAACGRDAGEPARAPGAGVDGSADTVTTDEAITAAVKSRLASDITLAELDIRVATQDGRVLLRGIAPDTVIRRQAADLARTVAGVVEVNNDLSVQMTPK